MFKVSFSSLSCGFLSFFFCCSSAKIPAFMRFPLVFHAPELNHAPVVFSGFSLIFFFLFISEKESRKRTENFSERSSINRILRKTKGYNGRKMHEKRPRQVRKNRTRQGLSIFCFRIKFFAPMRLKWFVLWHIVKPCSAIIRLKDIRRKAYFTFSIICWKQSISNIRPTADCCRYAVSGLPSWMPIMSNFAFLYIW